MVFALVAGLLLAIFGQRALTDDELSRSGLCVWLAGISIVTVICGLIDAPLRIERGHAPRIGDESESPGGLLVRLGFALLTAATCGLIWTEVRERLSEAGHVDIVGLWIGSWLLAIGTVVRPDLRCVSRIHPWLRTHLLEFGLVSAITLVGFGLRTFELDRYPHVFSGDEGKFGMIAREVMAGTLRKPFGTVIDGHPNLFFFLEAGAMHLFGNSVSGSRMVSALLGTATIPLVYALVRSHLGSIAGLTASGLIATDHFHLFLSRNAQNNASAPFLRF